MMVEEATSAKEPQETGQASRVCYKESEMALKLYPLAIFIYDSAVECKVLIGQKAWPI